MTLPRARIVRASDGTARAELLLSRAAEGARHRLAREELDARAKADRILGDARAQAEALVQKAREDAAVTANAAAREAVEQAEARFAARWLALRAEEAARVERDSDRLVALAVVLAERLLGAELRLHPDRVAELARTAMAEARGARRVVLEAHPADVELLRTHLALLGGHPEAVEVRKDEGLARGDLRLQTDIGAIDAKLVPRLERLAAALRDALG